MYSVLLVDDEKLIREGVSELLTMANLDLEITTAASAIDAIAVLENRKIDIAVMDISMPQMSGMELYDIVREQWPHCKLIFLTGFLEFDYVYKVHRHARYILKAEDDQKLVDAVRESINEIENDMLLERIGQGGFVPQLNSKYFERKILFKELTEYSGGGKHQILDTLAAANLDLELERDVYCVVLRCRALQTMDYAGWNAARESILALIDRYCMGAFRGECFGFNHSVLYLLVQPRKEMGRQKTVTQLEGIMELLQKAVNKNLSVPLSVLLRERPVSIDLAIRNFSALSDSMLGMESDEIRIADLAPDSGGGNAALSPEARRELSRKITQMESQFDSMDRDGIVSLLEELRTRLRGVKNMNDLFAMEMYYCVTAKLLSYIQRVGIREETAKQIGVSNLYTVTQFASWADAFANLKRVVEHVFHQVDSSIESKNEDVVNKVKHYIRHHLDGDTSLYALSSYVHLCPEHLLRIFKKQEGVTILQYINDVKLAKAKQMLTETDMQAKEIAVELGFTSAGYFGRFVKSKMGVTPNAYREQNRKKLSGGGIMKKRTRSFSGAISPEVSKRELENRQIARRAAADGMVLLKNDGVLPLKAGAKVALFGGGAVKTIKGGTGSGDVNEREVVGIYQGFADAGLVLTNRAWLDRFAHTYQKAREDWRDAIRAAVAKDPNGRFFQHYSTNIFRMPAGDPIQEQDLEGAEAAFYVISRTAGEDADRFDAPGDYDLTETEREQLTYLSAHCENIGLIINTGGQIDLAFIEALPNLKVLLVISQPGMEGGHALADIVTGKVTPSGKLADTWAVHYSDFPNSATFSHNNGDIHRERYVEGQYVGYRYFDSFDKQPAYPFGFGLSYTTFELRTESVTANGNQIIADVSVQNTGTVSGKEVVQVYLSCPQTDIPKVHKKLVGFAKTKTLAPGESQTVRVTFGEKDAASFDEVSASWIVEAGRYGVWVGNSSADVCLAAVLEVEKTVTVETVAHICPMQERIEELSCPVRYEMEAKWHALAEKEEVPVVAYAPKAIAHTRLTPNPAAQQAAAITEKLTEEQLIAMVIGEISKGQGQELGAAGIMVPGAAGETSSALEKHYDIPGVSMADGPAGLRLVKSYEVDFNSGNVIDQGFLGALEGGFFADQRDHENAQRYYQYATAIPVGNLLAQTWDVELLTQVGRAVAREMQEFGVGWWLAPGMNIHRNPLCGRNFEYYSEDPVVSGKMAAAITRGVQSVPGVGTTIKHFACNNQEDNRMGSNSILSERVLREIYLRGFEIAVKESQPMCIMTSYNLINGEHTANSYGLCTQAARNEWDFQGIIMTDWTTTGPRGGSTPWKCIAAGNDLIMPGCQGDISSIRTALSEGSLKLKDLKECVTRMLTVIFQTLAFEDPAPYGAQFQ